MAIFRIFESGVSAGFMGISGSLAFAKLDVIELRLIPVESPKWKVTRLVGYLNDQAVRDCQHRTRAEVPQRTRYDFGIL
jgi:hypothetical protein